MQIDLQVLAAPPPAGHLPSVLTKSDVAQVDHAAWVVSRAVLYCGIVCIILAWGCACFCFVRHCCWLKRRRGAAAAAAEADAEAGGAAGAAQAPTLKCPLPVVVVCPDNSWELGIKEDGLQAACDVAAAVPPPDKPHAPGGSASVPAPQRRYRVQLATAGVWLPADCAEADEGADGDATEGGSNIGCWYAGPAVHAGASSSSSSSSQHDSQAGSDRAGAGGAAQGDDGSCYSGGASGAARAGGEQPLRHGTSGHEASSVHGGSSTPAAPSHAA